MVKHIIIIGKNFLTTLGAVRSLAKSEFILNVVYVSSNKEDIEILAASKYIDTLVVVKERDEAKVIETLLNRFDIKKNKYMLFPTDDFSASCIDKFSVELKDLFLMQYVVGDSVLRMMDKSIQSKLARDAGLTTAEEWIVSLDSDIIEIPQAILYPCFVKPLLSAKGGKAGLYKCDTKEELIEKLNIMQSQMRNRSVLIQEYLNIIDEYTMGGVCNDQEVYIPAIIKKKTVAKSNRGVTLCGKMISEDEIKESMPAIIQFLKSVRFIGMFDLEVMATDKGLYFGELNLRCGGPSYSYNVCGVNLNEITVQIISEGRKPEKNMQIMQDKVFINDKVAWEDYSNLYLSRKELNALYKECDFALISDEVDTEPEKVFYKKKVPIYKMKRRKKTIKKLLHPFVKIIRGGEK